MALAPSTGPAPYAPATAVLAVIDRYREVGFNGQPVTDLTLQKIGISNSLIPRTLASLRLLGLIEASGEPSKQFDVLKDARPSEFNERLGEWLRDTYAPIFGVCNPSEATAKQIEEAFWGYEPAGQRSRMANLFTGLAERAGLIESAPSKPRGRHATAEKKMVPKGPAAEKKRREKAQEEPPPANVGEPVLSDYRKRYLEMLIQRAETSTDDTDLLDRIERALGIAPKEGVSP